MNSQTNLTVGDVTADEVEVEIRTPTVSIKAGEKLTYYQIEDGVENLIGVFYAEAPTIATKTSIRFKAYDGKAKLAADFSEWLNGNQDKFPMSLRTLVGHACETAGVPLAADSFQFDSLSIPAFYAQGVTCRQIVSWAAQIAGRFVSCNTAGEIFFDWYRKTDISIGKTDFSQDGLSKKAYSTDLIKRVQFKQETNDVGVIYPADADGNVFSISQNGIAAVLDSDTLRTIAQSLYEKLKSITYTPLSVKLPKRTAKIQAGDIISVTDGNGSTVSAYVMKVYLDSSGTQISSTGDQNYADKAAVSSEQYRNVPGKVLLLEKSVDGLRIENKDTADKVATLELTVDGLKTSVKDAEGDISKLEQSSKEITASVESVKKTSDEALKEAQKNATDLTNYATQVSGSLTDLQNQIDGAIETWFYDYEPTTANAPASSWTTTEDKNKHLGDLFYIIDNKDKGGLVYRWALVNGVYGWVLVEDTEVAKALETASKAKDTADGKRRVFVAQPKPPYDVGDLWTNNTDLYVCQTARSSENYIASDWKLATEYTTEKAVKALIEVAEESITLQVRSVEKKVDGIEVGGRNYFTTAKRLKGELTYMPGTVDFSDHDCPNGFYVVGDESEKSVLRFGDVITSNGEWTLSWEMRGSQSVAVGFRVDICDIDGGRFLTSADNSWTSHSLTINVTNYTADLYNFVDFSDISRAHICVRNIKLEKGNTATDWTPAPEDTEAEIAGVKKEVSALKVTSKGVDMVSEDSNGKLVSFIGNRDTGGVWEAKYTKNGAVTSALYFDFAKGSFVFDGHVVARSGEIGGCSIVDGKLKVPAANIYGALTFGDGSYYIDPGAKTSYLKLPGLEITNSGASFAGAIEGGSININDRFKVDALGNVTLPDNASISWGQVDNKPDNLATTDDIPSDDYITKITEDTVRTSNVVAKNLIVKAANIDGTLTANQIDISVGGRNYLRNSSFNQNFNSWYPLGDPEITTIDGATCGHFIGELGTGKCVSQPIIQAIDTNDLSQTYVFSADIRLDNFVAGTTNCYVALYFGGADTSGEWMGANAVSGDEYLDRFNNKGWVRVYRCVRFAKKPVRMDALIYARDFTGDLYFKNVKFERGNKATDWTPAPEDTEATVTKITNDTIATTNVVAQNLHVKAANIDGALTFGGGSYYIDPGATTTYLSLPGITVNKDGTTVEGELVTTAGGRVGGFFVDEHQLGIVTNTEGRLYIGRYGIGITYPSASDYRLFYASVDRDKVYAKNLYIKDATSYNLNISADRISFVFKDTEAGRIETYSTSVKLVGTWVGTSSQAITSDAGKKHEIVDLDDRYNTLFDLIRPVAYKYNDGTSDRYHTGFIANEVEEALAKAGISTQEFAGFVTIDEENKDGTTAKTRCLRYEEFIAVLWAKVKQLEKTLEAMKYATH